MKNILRQKCLTIINNEVNETAYGFYKSGQKYKVLKIQGNPRAKYNQKGMLVWSTTKPQVISWVKKWGTKKQKEFI